MEAGVLWAAPVCAPIPHGYLLGVDLPAMGPDAVCFTARDLPLSPEPLLAGGKVCYEGEPVAIVAAPTAERAVALARAAVVRTEALEPVTDLWLALSDFAPVIHEPGNLWAEYHCTRGEPEFSRCALVLEQFFREPARPHGLAEAGDVLTVPDGRGGAVLEGGGVPAGRARLPGAVTALTGRPARLAWAPPAVSHSGITFVRAGFDARGRVEVFEGEVWLDGGAYARRDPEEPRRWAEALTGPYVIPNVMLGGWLSCTNHPPACPGSAPSRSGWAVKALMDRAAEKLAGGARRQPPRRGREQEK